MSGRRRVQVPAATAWVLLMSLAGGRVFAQELATHAEPVAALKEKQEPDPFARNSVGIEFGAGVLPEAWNFNAEREWLVEGTAAIWWAFATGSALVVEFQNVRVLQDGSDAFVQGFSPLFRWRMRERRTWRLYAEISPGISWSDRVTPPRGTRFNYLLQAGFGVQRRLGANTHWLTSFRFLHVSNNGREGRGRNPDIEALGVHTGLLLRF